MDYSKKGKFKSDRGRIYEPDQDKYDFNGRRRKLNPEKKKKKAVLRETQII